VFALDSSATTGTRHTDHRYAHLTDRALLARTTGFALGTFSTSTEAPFVGLVIDAQVIPVRAVLEDDAPSSDGLRIDATLFDLLQCWQSSFAVLDKQVQRIRSGDLALGQVALSLSEVKILAPIAFPRQILCAGANYFKHVVQLLVDQGGRGGLPGTEGMDAAQLYAFATNLMTQRKLKGEPYFFNKPVSTVTGPFDPIYIPASAKQPDWELELGVYIGKAARYVKAADALDYVAGYTIVNDISDRTLLWRRDEMKAMGTDWVSGKSSPTYLPTGPFLIPAAYVPDPQNLRLTLKLNGEVKQDDVTNDMIHGVPRLIEYISSKVQLYPGDLICTGSPAGNGTHYNRFLQPRDVVECTISGLGLQRNPVLAEEI
jgi:2,4-didehydro-3-deoxy-L-rhamnonate hydrolase